LAALLAPLPATAANPDHGKGAWHSQSGNPPDTKNGKKASVKPEEFSAYTLNHSEMASVLAAAPDETSKVNMQSNASTLTLPAPDGTFQDFKLVESPVMEPALAALHPDIKNYRGRGITILRFRDLITDFICIPAEMRYRDGHHLSFKLIDVPGQLHPI